MPVPPLMRAEPVFAMPLRCQDMRRSSSLLAGLTLVTVVACGGGDAQPQGSPGPLGSPTASVLEARVAPLPSGDLQGELCLKVSDVERRLAGLQAVELRLPNRVALTIEFDKLKAAYVELERADSGDAEERLAGSLKRLGYRIDELELAVEDFRTNSRPRRAVSNVEGDAQKVADELAAFTILSRC